MATVTITVPDAMVPAMVAAVRDQHPEYAALADAAAVKQVALDALRDCYVSWKQGQANAAASSTIAAAVTAAEGDMGGVS
jgi:hypothetical protein